MHNLYNEQHIRMQILLILLATNKSMKIELLGFYINNYLLSVHPSLLSKTNLESGDPMKTMLLS